MSKARCYMFTLFAPPGEDLLLLDWDLFPDYCSYLVYQRELCPDTNREHFQGYLELNTPRPFTSLQRDCPQLATAHFERRRGTQAQAIAYCSKVDTRIDGEGPWEFGDRKAQGQRADLAAVKATIDSGASMKRVSEDHFTEFVKYERSFRSYKRLHTVQRHWPMQLILYLGPSGTGKTRAVRARFPEAYWKPHGKWWDQYDGEEVVVIDEMYGSSFPYTELLRLFDRYPHAVECKGGTIEFSSKIIVMTSNQEPEDWYSAERTHKMPWAESPLKRRLDEFCQIIRTGVIHRVPPPPPLADLDAPAPNPLMDLQAYEEQRDRNNW